MKVTTLLENTVCRDDFKCEHGLSLYIETGKHKLLFDMGPNAMFLENAEKLGVDLTKVDTAFLSHAHNDHCGGLELFCKRNTAAPVYLQKRAFGNYYVVTPSKCNYIGLDSVLKKYAAERFRYGEGAVKIDDELTVFSDIRTRDLWSHANDTLREKYETEYPLDAFLHEQNLLVTENGKTALFAGCAHNGIVNILRRAEEILGKSPDAVFAGFHLYNPSLDAPEPRELVNAVGEELKAREGTRYVTGHCTGTVAYGWLKEILGDRLDYMAGGTTFDV